MAEFPVGNDRDNLKLVPINQNGTISEMIQTIDENFKNIAAHGGGPDGLPGKDGVNGTDGTSAEYIFALCDEELVAGTHYPTTDSAKGDLFDSVEFTGSTPFPSSTNKKIEWFDHPQGVSKDHKNEYVFSRYKRTSGEDIWFYAEKPELWAHWGETGKDGDGVEYIFMTSRTELDESTLKTVIKSKESMSGDQYQPIIYQMDDFFPGEEWFTGKNSAKNKANAQKAIIAKYGNLPSNFETLWSNKFNMIVPGYNWTDDPKGTDPINVYEYVAIRRCNVDDEDGKEWNDFSTPAIWSHYGLSTRTIIIYCNKEGTTPPVQPQTGQGTWNESSGELTLPDSLVEAGWSDTNTTPTENQITWMCSGIFDNSGKNVSWSKPMRITGKDGKQGEDGTTIQFIYVLSENMPEHPNPTTASGKTETEKLFDDVEASTSKPKSVDRYGNTWFDRAQPISQSDPTEWVWSRRREKESDPWEYDDDPIIWAHWGEDGTDGDGVEYIFYITDTETFASTNNPPKISEIGNSTDLDKCKRLVYNMDDFYPDEKWFDDNETKIKKVITDAGYDESNYAGVKSFFDKGWRDNPIKVSPMNPYQWVSIRRSHADEETGGKRQWEDFSDPVLWNTYGQATRVFMIYCNVKNTADQDIAPRQPQGGFWNVNPGTGEVLLAQDKDHLSTPYQYDVFESGVTAEDRNNHINVWEDDNVDVPGTITWVSSGVFTTDGKLVDSWSQPFRITGYRGENGADGSNIEFIYALCDEMPQYPKKGSMSDVDYKAVLDEFFDDVNASDNEGYWPKTGNDRQKWTDNPQGISDDPGHKTEWVWQRSLPSGLEDAPINWVYMPAPVVWSRWGEDGTDGDGVEYIFYATTNNPLLNNQKPPKVSTITGTDNLSKCKRVIYNMREFFPNEDWFTSDNKTAVSTEVVKQNIMTAAEFDTLWTEHVGEGKDYFGFGIGWTDNPSDVNFNNPFEYVSIRRTVNDPESEKKIWGDYSEPKIWGTYNMKTKLFMVYRNVDEGTVVLKPVGGRWNYNEATGTDTFTPPTDWSDNNVDVPGKIAYLSSGLFAENGNNIYWSQPFRITGEKGRPGADGSTVEFVYCLSEQLPAFPNDPSNPSTDYIIKCDFFEKVENAKSDADTEHDGYVYTDPITGQTSEWFDNPQGISDELGSRKEWVWSRSKSAVTGSDPEEPESSTDWTFPESPVVWAHWGEDGTDGDGVEYVFIVKTVESYPDDATSKANWNSNWNVFTDANASVTAKAIYAMDDFYPGPSWFTNTNKQNVKDSMENPSSDFDESVWTQISTTISALGNWTDNPENISATYKYQYVSIRKSVDGKWGAFSYPKLWAKYNLTSFKAFAFTSTPASAELGNLTFQAGISGTINNPLPIDANHTWTDGPNPTEQNPQVWMTSATIREDSLNTTTWAKPQRMTDNAEFQVEWSSDDITGTLLADKILALKANTYNFGNYFTGNTTEDAAETAWRNAVNTGLGLTFGDSSNNAVLMATCHKSNGKWSNWDLVRVKGETGEAGTSINMKTPIIYEVYLDDNNYTIANARTKFNTVKSTLTTPTPAEGYLAVVYPHDMDTNDIYRGDPDLGNALYMCKYNGSAWVEYYNETTVSSTDEAPGDTHPSPNGHLILWDGDSWMDVGNIVGPAGPVSEILVKYAKDGATAGTHEFVPDNQPYTAKYVGFITYPAGERPDWSLDEDGVGPNGETWNWQLFKGQDGFGYEYIFKTTSTYSAPLIPVEPTGGNWSTTPNVIPGNGISDTTNRNYGWFDEPMEPEANSKYVWMCWRKYDHSTQTWTNFQGSTKTGHTNEARLWQVFANTITEVVEYFHADITMSPSDIDTPVTSTTYWKTDKSQCGWGASKKYLFNVEVIKFLDGNSQTLDPHLIAVWETGLIDVIDYYILESANGSQGDGDPGETAPHMNGGEPVTSGSSNPGKNYWITSVPKMDKDFPVLWNISKKTYDGGKPEQWTTPIVIGVYGEGKNGEDSIYIDLTNEMDSVQIDKDNKVITARTCSTTVKLYKGEELLEIADLDIAGEEAITGDDDLSDITVTRTYHKGNTSASYLSVSDYIDVTFTIPVGCELRPSHKIVFTVTSTEGIVRKTGYILVGTTHPAVYSIVPAASAVLVGENGNDPDPLRITVVKQTGSQLTSISGYSSSQGFKLNYQKNSGSKTELTNSPFSISTSNLSAGDKLILTVDVDTDGNNTYETTLDRETIYALIQGKNGAKGEGGNGYRYYYARYVNAASASYSGSTIPSLQSYASTLNTPVFLLNGVSLPGSSSAQGADGSHTFEYRTEKFFDGSNWSDWSNPITIAKYLTADNIEEQVNEAVTNATSTINTNLTNAVNRLNTLEGYIDPSTGVFSGTVSDTTKAAILYGYATTSDVSSAISSINLGGLKVDASGTETFSEWYNSQNSTLTDVATRMSAAEGTLSTAVTTTQLSDVTTAFENYKANAQDRFAKIDQTVANANYLTDTEGYLLVNIPEYVTWFRNETEMNGDYKDTDENRDVEWIMFSGTIYSEDNPETQIVKGPFETSPSPAKVSYDNLFNESKDKITFVLEESIYPDNINFTTFNLNSFKPTANSVEIEYDIETEKYIIKNNTSNLELRIPFNNDGTPNYSTSDGSKIICLIYVTCDLNTPTSKSGMKYTFTSLNWNIGISSISSSLGPDNIGQFIFDIRYVCTKTASIFESPVLAGSISDTFGIVDKYKQYGATVTPMGDSVPTNGKVSLSPYNVELLPVMNEATGVEWSVKDIMGYLTDGTTTITSSDLLSFDDTIYVDESKEFYMLWKRYNESSGGVDDFLNEYSVSLTGDNNKNKVLFDDRAFVNKHELTLSSGFDDYTDGQRRATGNGGTAKYDWYEMYLTSSDDEVKLDYNITFTNSSSASFVFRIDYYFGDEDPGTYDSVDVRSGNYSGTKTFSGTNVSIFEGINLESNKMVHFRVYLKPSSTTTSYDVSYKITSVNKFVDFEGGPIFDPVEFGGVGGFMCATTTSEYDSTLPWPEIPDDVVYITTIDYTFKYTYGFPIVAVFKLQSPDINTKGKLYFYSNNSNLQYIVLPANYTEDTVQTLINNCDSITSTAPYDEGGFLENEIYGTIGKTTFDWYSVNNNPTHELDFNNDSINIDDINYVTIILYMDGSSNFNSFNAQVAYVNETEITWNTDETDNHKRYTTCSGSGITHMIDKFTVNIGDRSRIGDVPYTKRKAKDKNGSNDPGVKNYIDVLDSDKPYLILSVSELATISQMVNDGIASTSIIAKAGDSTAVFFEQAVDGGGSQIYMNANEIGIESDYFKLDNNGLRLTGNLLAKNSSGRVTAGVIGDNSVNGIKFFAGTNTTEDSMNISNAPFRVYDDGRVVATNATISGDINANRINSSVSYEQIIEIEEGYPDTYSIEKQANMSADTFEIISTATNKTTSSNPETAKIYITVMDKLDVSQITGDISSQGTLTNVPVLCFEYHNDTYYLTPGVWKSLNSSAVYHDVYIYPLDGQFSFTGHFDNDFQVAWMVWIPESITGGSAITIENSDWHYVVSGPGDNVSFRWGQSFNTTPTKIPESLQGQYISVKWSIVTTCSENSGEINNIYVPRGGSSDQTIYVQMPDVNAS